MPTESAVRPRLAGPNVIVRSGSAADAARLHAIMSEPSITTWWGEPDPEDKILARLAGEDSGTLLVVQIDGQVAGGIQYFEEPDPQYRHAGIDIYLSERYQGRGAGREAIMLLARFLFDERGHHRITIDPAAANSRAIRCYASAGFRPVGVMRQYERGPDGTFHDGLLMERLRDDD